MLVLVAGIGELNVFNEILKTHGGNMNLEKANSSESTAKNLLRTGPYFFWLISNLEILQQADGAKKVVEIIAKLPASKCPPRILCWLFEIKVLFLNLDKEAAAAEEVAATKQAVDRAS